MWKPINSAKDEEKEYGESTNQFIPEKKLLSTREIGTHQFFFPSVITIGEKPEPIQNRADSNDGSSKSNEEPSFHEELFGNSQKQPKEILRKFLHRVTI